ncbi:hypothetical protein BJ970_006921 [Saccharopolyspora phatthalungensis]|uniref:Uncharacterized protein n=1 Tax=Saccharopolyspora phatthalungensis TaxID=664693 RepID=A0A840Q9W1_9PSEU|nr:hypothetical protein [Saccharopolyspora phatthalungensis]
MSASCAIPARWRTAPVLWPWGHGRSESTMVFRGYAQALADCSQQSVSAHEPAQRGLGCVGIVCGEFLARLVLSDCLGSDSQPLQQSTMNVLALVLPGQEPTGHRMHILGTDIDRCGWSRLWRGGERSWITGHTATVDSIKTIARSPNKTSRADEVSPFEAKRSTATSSSTCTTTLRRRNACRRRLLGPLQEIPKQARQSEVLLRRPVAVLARAYE